MRWFLNSSHKDHRNAARQIIEEKKCEYIKEHESEPINLIQAALWKGITSSCSYCCLSCAQTLVLIVKTVAEIKIEFLDGMNL
ncbi:MAG: hypothetical protein H5U07_04080 [Candidatus Aminicenantes bacterium]|nr:hypothetical protein [Candidatus Aminicenantes bacterium]